MIVSSLLLLGSASIYKLDITLALSLSTVFTPVNSSDFIPLVFKYLSFIVVASLRGWLKIRLPTTPFLFILVISSE